MYGFKVSQPVKEQPQEPWEERPKQLKILDVAKGPQEQAVTGRKSPDGGKGCKRPYWVLEEFSLDHHRIKYQKVQQHLQHNVDMISDPPRAHRALKDSLNVKSCMGEHSHGSRTTKCDAIQSTLLPRECLSPDKIVKMSPEESFDTNKKAGVYFEERRGHHFFVSLTCKEYRLKSCIVAAAGYSPTRCPYLLQRKSLL